MGIPVTVQRQPSWGTTIAQGVNTGLNIGAAGQRARAIKEEREGKAAFEQSVSDFEGAYAAPGAIDPGSARGMMEEQTGDMGLAPSQAIPEAQAQATQGPAARSRATLMEADRKMRIAGAERGGMEGYTKAGEMATGMRQQGYMSNMSQALQALSTGDKQGAATALTEANSYVANGVTQAFTVGADGELYLQNLDEETGQPHGESIEVTAEMLDKHMRINADPASFVAYETDKAAKVAKTKQDTDIATQQIAESKAKEQKLLAEAAAEGRGKPLTASERRQQRTAVNTYIDKQQERAENAQIDPENEDPVMQAYRSGHGATIRQYAEQFGDLNPRIGPAMLTSVAEAIEVAALTKGTPNHVPTGFGFDPATGEIIANGQRMRVPPGLMATMTAPAQAAPAQAAPAAVPPAAADPAAAEEARRQEQIGNISPEALARAQQRRQAELTAAQTAIPAGQRMTGGELEARKTQNQALDTFRKLSSTGRANTMDKQQLGLAYAVSTDEREKAQILSYLRSQ